MRLTWCAAAALVGALGAGSTHAGPDKPAPGKGAPPKAAPPKAAPPKGGGGKGDTKALGFDPAARDGAAQKGLAWLDANALEVGDSAGTPTKPFTLAFVGLDVLLDAGAYAPSAARARLLAAVRAYLAGYLEEVERRSVDPRQLPDAFGVADSSKLVQYVWPLAASAWLLSECVARDLDAAGARAQLKRIAKVLEEAQHSDGGWGHGRISKPPAPPPPPDPRGGLVLSGYPPTLLAPTNCAAAALGFLDAALPRPASPSAQRAVEHYGAAILANGNFPYDLRQRSADADLTGVGRTAGALVALHALGVPHDDPVFLRGAAFLRQHWDLAGEGHGSPVLNLMFGALAAWLLGPDEHVAFEKAWVPALLAKQSADGALDCACQKRLFGSSCDSPGEHGFGIPVFVHGQRAYVTALTTFVLLLDKARPRILEPKAPVTPRPAVTPR